jgi:YHS domain-containing protein
MVLVISVPSSDNPRKENIMIITAIATMLLGQGAVAAAPVLACPIMGSNSPATGKAIDYNGVRYVMCCGGCPEPFKKDPTTALKNEKLKGKLVGVSLFDPVSGARIEAKNAKSFADYNGIRYYFANDDEKKAFDAEPKKFTAAPKKEALYCAVMGHDLKDYATAGGYVDVEETRYYVCCADCLAAMKKDAPALVAKAKSAVKAPGAMDAPVKKG